MEKSPVSTRKAILPLLVVFVFVNLLLIALQHRLTTMGLDVTVLLYSNLILFGIFFISLLLHLKSMANTSTHAFMRSVYSGMLLKLFGGAIAAFIYIYLFREKVNKPALFGSMALYMVYTIIELRAVLTQSKRS